MSRIGIKPIDIPEGIEVKIEEKGRLGGQKIVVKGPLGELFESLRREVKVGIEDKKVFFKVEDDSKSTRSLHGLYRTLCANMIQGVTKGYKKDLEIVGIGYRAEVKGKQLELTLGATHPFTVNAPEGISFEVSDKVNITVRGLDKQLVGQVAATIRSLAKPEPYKGKGIRYKGEQVRKKVGKVAKGIEVGE